MLAPAEVRATAASIARTQEPDGAIPWSPGAHTDVWNHVEAAMGLVLGGEVEAARRAYDWCLATQRADGSWPMRLGGGRGEGHRAQTHNSADLAGGGWHHLLGGAGGGVGRRG